MAEDEDGIDLFADNFERDYKARENDAYEGSDLDDEGEYEDLDMATRRQLEARLNKRDRELARRRRMPAAFLQDENEDAEMDLTRQPRRRRHHYDEEQEDEEMGDDIMDEELSLETLQDVKASSLTDWVALPAVYRTIFREFKSFLTEYTDDNGTSVYGTRVRTLGEVNAESLEVSYDHLSASKAILAYFLANAPAEFSRSLTRLLWMLRCCIILTMSASIPRSTSASLTCQYTTLFVSSVKHISTASCVLLV